MATEKKPGYYYLDDIIEHSFTLPSSEDSDAYAVIGNSLDNLLVGNAYNNILSGGIGADTLAGGLGNDRYVVDNAGDRVVEAAGEGDDWVVSTVSYTLSDHVENLNLGFDIYVSGGALYPVAVGPGAALYDHSTGTLDLNIDGTGNAGHNLLLGNAGHNHLSGLDGNDTLNGVSGGDTLEGGNGDDTYSINSVDDVVIEAADGGNDTVYINVQGYDISRLTNVETIKLTNGSPPTDYPTTSNDEIFMFGTKLSKTMKAEKVVGFDVENDTIALSKAVFGKISGKGELSKKAFYTGAKAHDADDRIVYNKKTGALYYDADGSGKAAAIHFATLDKNLKLKADAFLLV